MNTEKSNLWLITGFLGLVIWGGILLVHLLQVHRTDSGDWWTQQPLTLSETTDAFELLIAKKTVSKHLSEGRLFRPDEQGGYQKLQANEILVRVNNWPQRRAELASFALLPAFFSGASLTLLIAGLAGKYSRKDGREEKYDPATNTSA